MKKFLALLLAAIMVLSLAACAPAAPNKPDDTKPSDTKPVDTKPADTEPPVEEPVTLRMWFHGSNVTNDADVMEKVNEYLVEKLNVKLEPIWGTWGDFDEAVTTALKGGDNCDIVFTCSWSRNEYNQYARAGYYVKLDDLIAENAAELWATLPQYLVDGATIMGAEGIGVYAIPGYKDYATQNCWDVNVTALEAAGYSFDDVKDGIDFYSDDFKAMCQAAKESGIQYPLCIEPAVLERMVTNTTIVTGDIATVNVLSYYIDPTDPSKVAPTGNTIYSKYENPEFAKFAEKIHEYYELGFVNPSAAIPNESNNALLAQQAEADYLFGTQSYALGYEAQVSASRGVEVKFVPTTPAFVDTTSSQGAMMAVSRFSEHPELAVKFLNLLNTDEYLYRLLSDGIEGVHYNTNEDGTITFVDEKRAEYSPWRNGVGNITLRAPLDGEGADYWEQFDAFYGAAKAIPVLGFSVNLDDLATETSAIANVATQYSMGLMAGALDPAVALPEFIQALKDAGIDTIVEAANEQLTTYLAG